MPASVLGRTNQSFPPVWLALTAPAGADPAELAQTAGAANTVLDITSSPALWGGLLRGHDKTFLFRGGEDVERATDEKHASDLVQAQLIQVLSCIGRQQLDFFCLRVRSGLEEFQINGALAALDEARQDGLLKWIGISCEGPALAALGAWQFHDAFDVLLVNRSHFNTQDYEMLSPLALERRVGIVTSKPLLWGGHHVDTFGEWGGATHDLARLRNLTQGFYNLTLKQALLNDLSRSHPVLVEVTDSAELASALEAPNLELPEGLNSLLAEYKSVLEVPA